MTTLTYPPAVASLDEFEATAHALGYGEVLVRNWPPATLLESHSHPFDARAQVTRGEFWLTVGDCTRHLQAGDTFELARDIPHAERYGEAGATYWVARR